MNVVGGGRGIQPSLAQPDRVSAQSKYNVLETVVSKLAPETHGLLCVIQDCSGRARSTLRSPRGGHCHVSLESVTLIGILAAMRGGSALSTSWIMMGSSVLCTSPRTNCMICEARPQSRCGPPTGNSSDACNNNNNIGMIWHGGTQRRGLVLADCNQAARRGVYGVAEPAAHHLVKVANEFASSKHVYDPQNDWTIPK